MLTLLLYNNKSVVVRIASLFGSDMKSYALLITQIILLQVQVLVLNVYFII